MDREQLEVDVVFVGAGPASLAGAFHLAHLLKKHREGDAGANPRRNLEDLTILVIDKGKRVGAHALSGAVIDPRGFDELLAEHPGKSPPYDGPVHDDALYWLTRSNAFRLPLTPPPLSNHGCFIASLGKVVEWLGAMCEESGVDVYPEFPAVELLFEGDSVVGVRTGDKGRDKNGNPRANFEAGIDVMARVTVLGEGPRGTLARQATERLCLREGSQPEIYAVGVKEVWRVPEPLEPGIVHHTLGFPLGTSEFGGGFIYTLEDNLVDLGYVVGLDYRNPHTDPHRLLQEFKTHPFVRDRIAGGKAISYGAKAIPEGGYYSMPRSFSNGLLIVGDSAGFLNSQRLKGIHLAVKSGMVAAETILEAFLAEDYSEDVLRGYSEKVEQSWAKQELWGVRNFRQSFQRGFWRGLVHAGLQYLSGGRGMKDPMPTREGHTFMQGLKEHFGATGVRPPKMKFDGDRTFDKLSSVFLSDTAHGEDQPCHLKILDSDICANRCTLEYGNPCQHFCPANVYEMVQTASGRSDLKINFTNCVHCKTCDIMDPYQIILWTPPEGGGGPDWKNM